MSAQPSHVGDSLTEEEIAAEKLRRIRQASTLKGIPTKDLVKGRLEERKKMLERQRLESDGAEEEEEEEEEEDDDAENKTSTDPAAKPVIVEAPEVESLEEAELRMHFPMSFGAGEKKPIVKSLEKVHDATRRDGEKAGDSKKTSKKKGKMMMSIGPIKTLPSSSASTSPAPANPTGTIGHKTTAPHSSTDSKQNSAATAKVDGAPLDPTASSSAHIPSPSLQVSSRPHAKDFSSEVLGPVAYASKGEGGSDGKSADHNTTQEKNGVVDGTTSARGGAGSGDGEQVAVAAQEEVGGVGPPRPPSGGDEHVSEDEEEGEGEDDGQAKDDDEEEEDPYHIPVANEIYLKGHKKVVSALAVDHTGNRVVSGSHDYNLRLYDFHGMKRDLQPFRKFDVPAGEHQVVSLSYSPNGDMFMLVPGSCQPKIFDRDGREEGVFPRGDMYIRDQKNTKGHVMGCTGGQWHPTERAEALTSSFDGTLRLWEVGRFDSQKAVLQPQAQRSTTRVAVHACCYSQDGRLIAGGLGDGSVHVWSSTGKLTSAAVAQVLPPRAQCHYQNTWKYSKTPHYVLRGAHDSGEEITSISFHHDNLTMLTRCSDHTLKVWDMRKLKTPLKVFEDLPNQYNQTQVAWSPDGSLFFTGVSAERGSSRGSLVFFEKSSLQMVKRVGMPSSPVALHWAPKTNQIIVGCGDAKEGNTHVLYDPTVSERGALLCMARAPRTKDPVDVNCRPVIHNPHALPMYREDFRKRKRDDGKDLKDPKDTKKPEQHLFGPGVGGRLGTTGGTLLTQYLMKERGTIKEAWMEEDARDAIMRHEKKGEFTKAYAETQPEPIYHVSDEEEED